MRHILNIVCLALSLVLGIGLVVGYASSFVSPVRLHLIAFTWFAVPYLVVLNALMALWLIIIHRWRTLLIPIAALVLSWGAVPRLVSVGTADTTGSDTLRILTFNIHFMSMADDKTAYSDFFRSQNADVICLQEAAPQWQLRGMGIKDLKAFAGGYKYRLDRTFTMGSNKHSPVFTTLSRYPIRECAVTDTAGRQLPFVLGAEMTVGEQKVMLLNVHLESIRLKEDQIGAVNKAVRHPLEAKEDPKLRSTGSQLLSAFVRRAEQVEQLSAAMEKIDMPIIVCGDFNDTPISYTYNTLTHSLSDSFCEARGGFGRTYNGNLPPLRIDYVLHSPHFRAVSYREHRVDLSDHYPVVVTLAND